LIEAGLINVETILTIMRGVRADLLETAERLPVSGDVKLAMSALLEKARQR
jgi:hypothetical protein